MYVKRRRRGRKPRISSKNSILQSKKNNTGMVVFLIASLFTLLSAVVIGIFVFQKLERQSQADIVAEAVTETESQTESPVVIKKDPEKERQEKLKAQKKEEERIHQIQPGIEFAHFKGKPTCVLTGDEVLDEANRLAAGYDYDAAIKCIKKVTGFGNVPEYTDAIAKYTAEKNSLKPYEVGNKVTHIFFHSLIVDPTLAFSKEVAGVKVQDYNEAMTTVDEFVAMMEEMYRKGYVLVDIYDVAKMEEQPDGTKKMVYQTLMLPDGKTPFILSCDDTNYYEYMEGHGFANRLVVTDEGKVENEMRLTDQSTVTGAYDVLPILENFIEMHPDFAYHNARGILGITGYNGVLGYRTSDFWYGKDCPYFEATEANLNYRNTEITYPNLNIEADKKTAKKVAKAIREMNWRFASHTWGHKRLGEVPMETLIWDSDMWEKEVESLLGDTDLLIFPYGNDIGQTIGWKEYEYEGPNERYQRLKAKGFDYFMNVDSAQFFMQKTDNYFRQGRRNLDGDRLWEAYYADQGYEGWKNRLTDLFDDVSKIIDKKRPEFENVRLVKTESVPEGETVQ